MPYRTLPFKSDPRTGHLIITGFTETVVTHSNSFATLLVYSTYVIQI